MAGVKPVEAADTCVLLAWIMGEQRKPEEIQGIRALQRRVDKNEVILIASAICQTEILPSKTGAQAMKMFTDLFKRSNVKSIPADIRVNQLAGEIRDYYQQRRTDTESRQLSTPDAIHLATAILYKADVFYTFDEKGNNDFLGLLPLNGNVAGYPLRIERPLATQQELEFGKGS